MGAANSNRKLTFRKKGFRDQDASVGVKKEDTEFDPRLVRVVTLTVNSTPADVEVLEGDQKLTPVEGTKNQYLVDADVEHALAYRLPGYRESMETVDAEMAKADFATTPKLARVVTLTVDSTPAEVEVLEGDQKLTPVEGTKNQYLVDADVEHTLVYRLAGYRESMETVDAEMAKADFATTPKLARVVTLTVDSTPAEVEVFEGQKKLTPVEGTKNQYLVDADVEHALAYRLPGYRETMETVDAEKAKTDFTTTPKLIRVVTLTVDSTPPEVEVLNEGKKLTPVEGTKNEFLVDAEMKHTLIFRKQGYRESKVEIEAKTDDWTERLTLTPVGTLVVESDPPEVEVFAGETELTPVEGTKNQYVLEAGVKHDLIFRKEGYVDGSAPIILASESTKHAVKLSRKTDVIVKLEPNQRLQTQEGLLQPGAGSLSLAPGHHYLNILTADGKYVATLHIEIAPNMADVKIDPRDPGIGTVEPGTVPSFVPFSSEVAGTSTTGMSMPDRSPALPHGLKAAKNSKSAPGTGLPDRAVRTIDGIEIEFVLLPAASFAFGVNGERFEGELPAETRSLGEPAYISAYEISRAQYAAFAAKVGESAGTTWTTAREPGDESLPVTNIAHAQAEAFCRWLGGRLPSETEWEYAVRGPDDQGYPLPWGGDDPSLTPDRCNLFFAPDAKLLNVDAHLEGASRPFGLRNALGNAAEWTADPYVAGYDEEISDEDGLRAVRGASFLKPEGPEVRTTWRAAVTSDAHPDVGFRALLPLTPAQGMDSLPPVQKTGSDSGPVKP